jgi:hypothetical protein
VAAGEAWSEIEVGAVVADYFAMFEKELRGESYNKTEHRRNLRRILKDRSGGSIERKHQNISAILIEAGHPYIVGYKPLSQYQGLLADVVLDRIESDAAIRRLAGAFVDAEPSPGLVSNLLGLMRPPPDLLEAARIALATQRMRRFGRTVDYLAREARNRAIGREGEELVVRFERSRLSSLGKDTLADRVEHVAVSQGDGLGYDVRSFFDDGRERFIEVKTTQLGAITPFYITSSEVAFSTEHSDRYSLYRVYDFRRSPAMYSLEGAVEGTCDLQANEFLALPRVPGTPAG